MGSDTLNHNPEIEDLYEKMILKLKELARLMDKSSARVLEQEDQNGKLRCKLAGLQWLLVAQRISTTHL
ncbi:hypothetical protein VitviT2T_008404 [Vitis vinifera]|uniref:Uncharacterized protein n=1 Tax=Vitis vinifera TaxID=29760 RepID=A0ABY9C2F4_VITVI|nr:hypothetical protein VitviT2T_008404 [Vitis vinifera]